MKSLCDDCLNKTYAYYSYCGYCKLGSNKDTDEIKFKPKEKPKNRFEILKESD
jgi:hypothetical protein